MIILRQLNFSEEQRLFGYWKKINKALKKEELLREHASDKPLRIDTARSLNRSADFLDMLDSGRKSDYLGPGNINQLINRKSVVQDTHFSPYRAIVDPCSRALRKYVKKGKIDLNKYDHPSDLNYGDIDDPSRFKEILSLRKEGLLKYKNYREKLKDQFEQKLEKDLKRDKLGLAALGTAALAYGGYKLYQKHKNNNKEKDNKKED